MIDAGMQVFQRLGRERLRVQTGKGSIDILDGAAQILNEQISFASKVVDSRFAGAFHGGFFGQELFRWSRWHDDVDEAISEKSRAADCEFASRRNFHVI